MDRDEIRDLILAVIVGVLAGCLISAAVVHPFWWLYIELTK